MGVTGVVGGVSIWLLGFWEWAWGVRLSGLTAGYAVFSHPLFSFSFPLPSAEPQIPESRFSYLCSPEIKLASLVQAHGVVLLKYRLPANSHFQSHTSLHLLLCLQHLGF